MIETVNNNIFSEKNWKKKHKNKTHSFHPAGLIHSCYIKRFSLHLCSPIMVLKHY